MKKWIDTPIRDIGRVITGKTPSTTDTENYSGTLPFFSPKDLKRDSFHVSQTETTVSEKAYEKQKNQIVPADSILYTSLSYGFGKIGICTRPVLTNQQISSVCVKNEYCNKFIYYLLRASTPYIFTFNSGIDTPIVPKSIFEKIKLPIPTKDIQRKIAAILSAYDDLIEVNERRIALLERMAEELYREWFVRMRFPGNNNGLYTTENLPQNWRRSNCYDELDILSGGTPKTDIEANWNGKIPFFTPKDATAEFYVLNTEKHLSENGLRSCNSILFPTGTIFITARGTVGKLSINALPMAINQSCYALVPKSRRYMSFYFLTLKNTLSIIKGTANSGVFDNIIVDSFKNYEIAVPPEGLICAFCQKIDPFFNSILKYERSTILLRTTRDRLLSRLMSGALDVEELDIAFPPSMEEELAASRG